MVSARPFSDLRSFLDLLEIAGNLVHFGEELSRRYEIPAAMDYIARHIGKTVVFDKVKGYDIPVAGNLYVSRKHLAIAFGVEEEQLEQTYLTRAENLLKPKMVTTGPVQDVVIKDDVNIQ